MWLLRNWVESYSRPIRKKTPCSKKSGSLTSTNLHFDFEIGNSDLAVKHEIQKRLSTLRNPSSKWISIKKSSSGSHGFICFAFFREIQKGSLLGEVSIRLIVGYKKKKKTKSLGFFIENPPWVQNFQRRNPFLLFIFYYKIRNLYFKILIWIYQSKAPRTLIRAVFSIFHKYSHLFWTFLDRNNIIFIKPTAFRLFDHLIKATLGSKFLQNWLIHV